MIKSVLLKTAKVVGLWTVVFFCENSYWNVMFYDRPGWQVTVEQRYYWLGGLLMTGATLLWRSKRRP